MDIMIPKESFPEIEYENQMLFPRYDSVVTLRQDNKIFYSFTRVD